MRTIKDIIELLNKVAFRFSRGYNEFSNSPIQSWGNGFRGIKLSFAEYTTRRPDTSCFTAKISSVEDVEFVDSRNYVVTIGESRFKLDDILYQNIDECRLPNKAKKFLIELDNACVGIMQRQLN